MEIRFFLIASPFLSLSFLILLSPFSFFHNFDIPPCLQGGIGIRFLYRDTSICFLNAHLAAHQSHVEERNEDARTILGDEIFPAKKDDYRLLSFPHTLETSNSNCFALLCFALLFSFFFFSFFLFSYRAGLFCQRRGWLHDH